MRPEIDRRAFLAVLLAAPLTRLLPAPTPEQLAYETNVREYQVALAEWRESERRMGVEA